VVGGRHDTDGGTTDLSAAMCAQRRVEALEEVEQASGPVALVTTGGQPKFYSNGLDLEWLIEQGPEGARTFLADVQRFLARVLGLSVPTVAAINGHAFAAGAMLALAHDYRVMRADRGFFCLSEIDLGLPLPPGMLALVQAKLDQVVCRDLILTGRRTSGQEAAAMRIVDAAMAAADVLPEAVARAAALAEKDRATFGAMKRAMYRTTLHLLEAGLLDHA
jgi:enoyl-CoA hydratase/carnithine racemase